MSRTSGTARLLTAAAACAALGGCLRRRDYVPPPPPLPVVSPATDHAVAPGLDGPLTATDAVRLVLARNPDLRGAEARIAEARAGLAQAEAAFWPRLSADASYLVGDAPSAFLFKRIDARALPPNVNFNDPGQFSNLEGGLTLRWNLWNGGRDLLGRWAADTAAESARLARDAAANGLVAAAVAAYLDGRAAGELLAADDANVRTVEAQVEESRVKVRGGGAVRSDLLSLEVRLAEAREQRVRSEVAQHLALAALRELLALPSDAPLELAEGSYDAGPLPPTPAEALAEAYHRRPEAQIARRAIERARLELAAARRAYLPRLDVESRLYADDAEARFSPRDRNWTVAVALSADLFDGGARAATIRQARAALDELTETDRRTLLAVAREVETAYLHLDAARTRSAVAARAVGAADETFEIVSVQYRGGAATITRYLEVEAARARARTARIEAQLDVDRAAVEASRAIGRLVTAAPAGAGS